MTDYGMDVTKSSVNYSRHTTAEFGVLTLATDEELYVMLEKWYPATATGLAIAAVSGGIRITASSAYASMHFGGKLTPKMPALKGYEAAVSFTLRIKGSGAYTFGLSDAPKVTNGTRYPRAVITFNDDGKLRISVAAQNPSQSNVLWNQQSSNTWNTVLYTSAAVANFSWTDWTTWNITILFPTGGSNTAVRVLLSVNGRTARETDVTEDATLDALASLLNGCFPFIYTVDTRTTTISFMELSRS